MIPCKYRSKNNKNYPKQEIYIHHVHALIQQEAVKYMLKNKATNRNRDHGEIFSGKLF